MTWRNTTPAELAADWIGLQRTSGTDARFGDLAQFFYLGLPQEQPELTWETIRLVLHAYPEADFYAETETEAQIVCGVLAAGPVEDLLSFHGSRFIEKFEDEARHDRRMAWLLGGVWQFHITDEIWRRVELAADRSYWTRKDS
jgi:hypothetical protein